MENNDFVCRLGDYRVRNHVSRDPRVCMTRLRISTIRVDEAGFITQSADCRRVGGFS